MHDEQHGQGYDGGRATADGVIVAEVFALLCVNGIESVVAPRLVGVVRVPGVLGELLGPVGRRQVGRQWETAGEI